MPWFKEVWFAAENQGGAFLGQGVSITKVGEIVVGSTAHKYKTLLARRHPLTDQEHLAWYLILLRCVLGHVVPGQPIPSDLNGLDRGLSFIHNSPLAQPPTLVVQRLSKVLSAPLIPPSSSSPSARPPRWHRTPAPSASKANTSSAPRATASNWATAPTAGGELSYLASESRSAGGVSTSALHLARPYRRPVGGAFVPDPAFRRSLGTVSHIGHERPMRSQAVAMAHQVQRMQPARLPLPMRIATVNVMKPI